MASRLHRDGDPILENYEDVFNYIVREKDKFGIEQAVTLHLFHLHLRRSIEQSESASKQRMSRDDTDAYISKWIGTEQIVPLAKMAFDYIEGIKEVARSKERAMIRNEKKRFFLLKSVSVGVITNAVTFGIAVGLTFGVAITNSMNTDVSNAANRIAMFVDRCVGTSFAKPISGGTAPSNAGN